MALLDEKRAERLTRLARDRFDPKLHRAELRVLSESADSANLCQLYQSTPEAPRPPIRPEFLCWLATDPDAAACMHPKGLRVHGVTVAGKLDLEGCRVSVPLHFCCCIMEGGVQLAHAETKGILIKDSTVKGGITADGIDVRGSVHLRRSSFSSEVRFMSARIKGDLNCQGAKIRAAGAYGFSADGAEVGGTVFLSDGFECSGGIHNGRRTDRRPARLRWREGACAEGCRDSC